MRARRGNTTRGSCGSCDPRSAYSPRGANAMAVPELRRRQAARGFPCAARSDRAALRPLPWVSARHGVARTGRGAALHMHGAGLRLGSDPVVRHARSQPRRGKENRAAHPVRARRAALCWRLGHVVTRQGHHGQELPVPTRSDRGRRCARTGRSSMHPGAGNRESRSATRRLSFSYGTMTTGTSSSAPRPLL
jgi:hypothetical protein